MLTPVFVSAVLLTFVTGGCSLPKVGLMVGDKAIDFTLRDANGQGHNLTALLEEKPVVLIFGSYT
jgi:cytochrome oxidase Cu insertion factor (SCO1/SenC/PrrC family)